eukprot:GHVU01037750.1.p1 GENE.GHVU01037750.1~~GHVU01037750.1.p1  ORF type:complete len:222 (+),score=21.49 GHVU01037750.1:138-803(+)
MRFEKLKKVSLCGYCASKGFASISNLCAQSLVQLICIEYEYDAMPVIFEGNFGKLEKLTLEGRGAATCFFSLSVSCSGSLKELTIVDRYSFVKMGGHLKSLPQLTILEKLRLEILDLDFYVATVSSCGGLLRNLTIGYMELYACEAAIRDMKLHLKLERLTMKGCNARRCFAAMSESVASSLLVLSLDDNTERGHNESDEFYGPIKGNFEKLEKLEMLIYI